MLLGFYEPSEQATLGGKRGNKQGQPRDDDDDTVHTIRWLTDRKTDDQDYLLYLTYVTHT